MLKKAVFWMIAFCLVFFAALAGIPGGNRPNDGAQFSRQKTDLDEMLSRLESLVNKVDTRKIITIEDDADINELLEKCPEKLNEMDEEVSKNPQLKHEFSQILTAHQQRGKALHSKLTSMETQAKAAKIVPDKSMLLGYSSAELQKYKNFLSAEGLSRVKQMYPEIFNRQPDLEPPSQESGMISGPNLDDATSEYHGALSISSAVGVICYDQWQSCKNDCNSATFKWACRAGCWLKYIVCCISHTY